MGEQRKAPQHGAAPTAFGRHVAANDCELCVRTGQERDLCVTDRENLSEKANLPNVPTETRLFMVSSMGAKGQQSRLEPN